MIIIADKFGQLGNRLLVFAHFIACAIEHKFEVMNPSFGGYSEYFKTTTEDFFCRYPQTKSLLKGGRTLRSLFYRFVALSTRTIIKAKIKCRFLDTITLDPGSSLHLSDKTFLDLARRTRILIVRGWEFRDQANFEKHADAIREFFTPVEPLQRNIGALMREATKDCDVIVGVHIRHGDYRVYADGKYFYNTDQYANIMEKVENLFSGNKVGFLICSDEKQDEAKFSKFRFNFGNGHIVGDMYSFAQCNYLIGAPSTYTMWASFYGGVPLYMIEDPAAAVSFESFRVWAKI